MAGRLKALRRVRRFIEGLKADRALSVGSEDGFGKMPWG